MAPGREGREVAPLLDRLFGLRSFETILTSFGGLTRNFTSRLFRDFLTMDAPAAPATGWTFKRRSLAGWGLFPSSALAPSRLASSSRGSCDSSPLFLRRFRSS